jgi:hypothetical protein
VPASTQSIDPGKMAKNLDSQFYDRADAYIALANEQANIIEQEKVSASMMYATARFNSFVSACRSSSAEDLAAGKEAIVEYFVKQFEMMLVDNLTDCISNYDKYVGRDG